MNTTSTSDITNKTASTLILSAIFGQIRRGSTLTWNSNETRGTLGWRVQHNRTEVDLIANLNQS